MSFLPPCTEETSNAPSDEGACDDFVGQDRQDRQDATNVQAKEAQGAQDCHSEPLTD